MSAEYRAMTVTARYMLAENSWTGPVLAVGGSRAARSGEPGAWCSWARAASAKSPKVGLAVTAPLFRRGASRC